MSLSGEQAGPQTHGAPTQTGHSIKGQAPGTASRTLVHLIRGYQRNISGLKTAPTCRFTPSCSEYAAQAIGRFGVIRGTWLAAWRIARCNPFVEGGADPVPASFPSKRTISKGHCEKTNP